MIQQTVYNNKQSRSQLNRIINNRLIRCCPIGFNGHTTYTIKSGTRILAPSNDGGESTASGRQKLDRSINLNVEPVNFGRAPGSHRQQQNFSEEPIMSNESDDSPSPGIVFQQLRHLTFYGTPWRLCIPLDEAKKAQWVDTRFVVGVQIMSNGSAGPV